MSIPLSISVLTKNNTLLFLFFSVLHPFAHFHFYKRHFFKECKAYKRYNNQTIMQTKTNAHYTVLLV